MANDNTAVGLVPQTYTEIPLMPEIYVLIGGDVYRDEVEEAFGDDLEDAAVQAMDGIRFYGADGTPDVITLPIVTSDDEGKVLTVDEDGNWAAAEVSGGGASYEIVIGEDESDYTCNKTYDELMEILYDHEPTAVCEVYPNAKFTGLSMQYGTEEEDAPLVLTFIKEKWGYQGSTLVHQLEGHMFTVHSDDSVDYEGSTPS